MSSNIDIIRNDIKASSELLKHIMTAVYTMGDATNSKEGITVYADKSMLKDQQRRTVIDTGVLQDLFGPDSVMSFLMSWIVKPIAKGALDIGVTVGDIALDLTRFLLPKSLEEVFGIPDSIDKGWVQDMNDMMNVLAEPGKYQAESIVIGSMQRNFSEMYQGEVISFGMPSMKPLDLFYLNDERRMMSGTVQVGKITHTLSRHTGFISVIKPDLIVSRVDGKGERNVVLQTAMLGLAAGSMFALRHVSKTKFAGRLASGSYKRMKSMSIKTAKGADWISNRFTGLKPLEHFAKYLDETKVDDWVKKGANWLRRGIVTTVFAGVAIEAFSRWWDKETKYNNVIYIHPLFKAGVPFTAGIKGAMHIIPNYIDPKYYDPTGAGNGVLEELQSRIPPDSTSGSSVIENTTAPTLENRDVLTKQTTGAVPFKKYSGLKTDIVTKSYVGYGTEKTVGHPFGTQTSQRVSNFNPLLGDHGVGLIYKAINSFTPNVLSIASGTVVLAKTVSGKGLTVVVQHVIPADAPKKQKVYYSSYSHLKAGSVSVKVNDTVSLGTKIGVMGNTESSTTKLHLEIHIDEYTDSPLKGTGTRVNPVDFFKKVGVTI